MFLSFSTLVCGPEVIFYSIFESVTKGNKLVESTIESIIETVKNFLVINKINSDSSYFDVSNFEYVDPSNQIPIDLIRLIKRMKWSKLKKL